MATSKLKLLREINNYTQEYVAETLKMSQNTYSRLEKFPQYITAEQAKKLADLYNVNIADLLSDASPVIIFKDPKFDTANNAYVNHVENDNRQFTDKALLESLQNEIAFLRQQNLELLKLLGERKEKN